MLTLRPTDRILILAPHPDDESLAAGGLIQKARAAGAAVRVLFLTNGDDNPWPQRILERRLRLAASDRARWGRRRREEAKRALARLAGNAASAAFLRFPDQGLTQLLLHGGESVIGALRAEFGEFRPTLLVMPSASDRHPDHTALHVLTRIALDPLFERIPRVLEYLIHRPRRVIAAPSVTIRLSAEEIETKRAAILCHETQVALSGRRFLAYAQAREHYTLPLPATEACAIHPVRHASFAAGALCLTISRTKPALPTRLLLALQSQTEGDLRWSLRLPARSGCVHLRDEVTGGILRRATVRTHSHTIEVRVPITGIQPLLCAFVKVTRPSVFYDSSGWREVPLAPTPATTETARANLNSHTRSAA